MTHQSLSTVTTLADPMDVATIVAPLITTQSLDTTNLYDRRLYWLAAGMGVLALVVAALCVSQVYCACRKQCLQLQNRERNHQLNNASHSDYTEMTSTCINSDVNMALLTVNCGLHQLGTSVDSGRASLCHGARPLPPTPNDVIDVATDLHPYAIYHASARVIAAGGSAAGDGANTDGSETESLSLSTERNLHDELDHEYEQRHANDASVATRIAHQAAAVSPVSALEPNDTTTIAVVHASRQNNYDATLTMSHRGQLVTSASAHSIGPVDATPDMSRLFSQLRERDGNTSSASSSSSRDSTTPKRVSPRCCSRPHTAVRQTRSQDDVSTSGSK